TLEKATTVVLNHGVEKMAQTFDFLFDSKTGRRQPDQQCGYPGFDLYCSHKNDTVLELPTSVKTFVNSIDYEFQIQYVFLAFQFNEVKYSLDDYTLFNCTPEPTDYSYYIRHLSSSRHAVYAFPSDSDIDSLPILSCRKIYSFSSFPRYMCYYSHSLELTWSGPKCGLCEGKGKKCRFENNSTDLKIECFDPDKDKAHKRITNQFTEKLGQGAYGTVFKGKFSNEIHAAVKILNSSKGNGEEFINEVGTMGRIHHVNVVRLVGFCADGFRRALVYEFLPNDSLEKFISSVDSNCFLGWEKLQDIALGIAKGIEYLHQGCDQRILHFEIKPHNILLDQNFNPKISDFGLAKLCAKDQSVVSMTTTRGTVGYIAPEVFSRNFGSVSYKSDVYSFGILLLEMVGGRKNVDITMENTSQIYFPEWIYNLLEQKEDLRVYVEDNGDAKIAKKLAIVGLWCIQWHPVDRPSMKVVVQMLEGEGDKLTMPPNPFASTSPTKINISMPARRLNQESEVILDQSRSP
ncbi:hypothetical protein ACB092_12G048200, partial [Castanea dentata]